MARGRMTVIKELAEEEFGRLTEREFVWLENLKWALIHIFRVLPSWKELKEFIFIVDPSLFDEKPKTRRRLKT